MNDRSLSAREVDESHKFRRGGRGYDVMCREAAGTSFVTTPLRVAISPQGIELDVSRSDEPGIRVPWKQVARVVVDGPDNFEKRVNPVRAAMFGAMAFAFPKVSATVYLYIETDAGENRVYYVEDVVAPAVRTWFRPYESKFGGLEPKTPASTDQPTVQQRLDTLNELLDKGYITAREHEGKRNDIIAGI